MTKTWEPIKVPSTRAFVLSLVPTTGYNSFRPNFLRSSSVNLFECFRVVWSVDLYSWITRLQQVSEVRWVFFSPLLFSSIKAAMTISDWGNPNLFYIWHLYVDWLVNPSGDSSWWQFQSNRVASNPSILSIPSSLLTFAKNFAGSDSICLPASDKNCLLCNRLHYF